MERTVEETITYTWDCEDVDIIPVEHLEALEKDALSRITEMRREGFTSGELFTSVRYGQDIVPEEDPEEGLEYTGWWSVNTKVL